MEQTNIWDNITFEKDTPNVLKELKIQAEKLSDKTEGLLYAEINPVDAYDANTFLPTIVYNFYIYAPYLGNYRRVLFTVAESDGRIYLIDKINDTPKMEVNDIKDLISKIGGLISKGDTAGLISKLFASSLELKSNS